MIRQLRARRYDGALLHVQGTADTVVQVRLLPADAATGGQTIEVPLAQLASEDRFEQIDEHGNSLLISRTADDRLRVVFGRDALVFAPGERWGFSVWPHELRVPAVAVRGELRLVPAGSDEPIWTEQRELRADSSGYLQPLQDLALTMPSDEGVYNLEVELSRRSSAPFSLAKVIRRRTVQLVVVEDTPGDAAERHQVDAGPIVTEFDPTSSSWREHLPKIPTPTAMRRWLPGTRRNGCAQPWRDHPGSARWAVGRVASRRLAGVSDYVRAGRRAARSECRFSHRRTSEAGGHLARPLGQR